MNSVMAIAIISMSRFHFCVIICLSFLNFIFLCSVIWLPNGKSSSYANSTSFSIINNIRKKSLPFNNRNGINSIAKLMTENTITENSAYLIKKICPYVSPLLVGWLNISSILSAGEKKQEIDAKITKNGRYKPEKCKPRYKVAIIVPFRHRQMHLKIFLRHMHPFLQRQQLEYMIFVVEQSEGSPFNRGMLFNIGYKEANKKDLFACFIFHDVDLLPEDDRNLYRCPQDGKPRHLAFSMDIYDYKPAPSTYFGGVNAFSTGDFQLVNGFSNLFWGWGSEDDDLYRRTLYHNLTVTRMDKNEIAYSRVSHYRMLDHDWVNPNPDRERLFNNGRYQLQSDGLSDLYYLSPKINFLPLYVHILVDIQQNTL